MIEDGAARPASPDAVAAAVDGWFDGRVHFLPLRVYYEDTDLSGLVYHANYLRFMERGRSAYLRALGIGHHELLAGEDKVSFVVLRIHIDYLKAARIDDNLLVRTGYDRIDGARLYVGQSIWRGAAQLIAAQVEACCIRLDGRPRRPPATLVERITPLLLRD